MLSWLGVDGRAVRKGPDLARIYLFMFPIYCRQGEIGKSNVLLPRELLR